MVLLLTLRIPFLGVISIRLHPRLAGRETNVGASRPLFKGASNIAAHGTTNRILSPARGFEHYHELYAARHAVRRSCPGFRPLAQLDVAQVCWFGRFASVSSVSRRWIVCHARPTPSSTSVSPHLACLRSSKLTACSSCRIRRPCRSTINVGTEHNTFNEDTDW